MKKITNPKAAKAKKQVADMAHAERKLRQDMPRPAIIPNKKKQADKKACRGRT